MKTVSCFTVSFRRIVCGIVRRPFASNVKADQSAEDPLKTIKPNQRSGILAAIEKDNGFPSYLILKETSPLLRSVLNVKI